METEKLVHLSLALFEQSLSTHSQVKDHFLSEQLSLGKSSGLWKQTDWAMATMSWGLD